MYVLAWILDSFYLGVGCAVGEDLFSLGGSPGMGGCIVTHVTLYVQELGAAT